MKSIHAQMATSCTYISIISYLNLTSFIWKGCQFPQLMSHVSKCSLAHTHWQLTTRRWDIVLVFATYHVILGKTHTVFVSHFPTLQHRTNASFNADLKGLLWNVRRHDVCCKCSVCCKALLRPDWILKIFLTKFLRLKVAHQHLVCAFNLLGNKRPAIPWFN